MKENRKIGAVLLLSGAAFLPAMYVAEVNAPKEMLWKAEATIPEQAQIVPMKEASHPEAGTKTPTTHSRVKRIPIKQLVCGIPRDLEMGSGQVRVCEWQ